MRDETASANTNAVAMFRVGVLSHHHVGARFALP